MKKLILLIGLVFSISIGFGQEECFPKKKDGQFVYDIGNVLSDADENILQAKLKAFTKRTSNVLVIVTTNDLCGTDKSQFAIELGDQLGVGRSDKDNGLVFLVKPKIGNARGEVFIAVGTGLQGAITDAGTRRIIDYEIIPYFKKGSYISGINAGSEILMRLAEGEISEADYLAKGKGEDGGMWIILVFFLIFIVFIFLAQKYGDGGNDDWENYDRHGKHRGGRRGGGIPWIIIGGGGSRGGGGGFGGGGFGGFGGGGFSGGGAGGSW